MYKIKFIIFNKITICCLWCWMMIFFAISYFYPPYPLFCVCVCGDSVPYFSWFSILFSSMAHSLFIHSHLLSLSLQPSNSKNLASKSGIQNLQFSLYVITLCRTMPYAPFCPTKTSNKNNHKTKPITKLTIS